MRDSLPCLRRIEPSAALIPHAGQRTLSYVPAEQSDIRRRMHEFNRSVVAHLETGESTEVLGLDADLLGSGPVHIVERP